MNRRRFLQRTSILSGGLALALPEITREQDLTSRSWQTFEITTHIEILKPAGVTRVWAPVSLLQETPFQKTTSNTLHYEAGTASIVKRARGLNLIAAEFPPGAKPALTLTTQVETRNWVVDFSVPGNPRRALLQVGNGLRVFVQVFFDRRIAGHFSFLVTPPVFSLIWPAHIICETTFRMKPFRSMRVSLKSALDSYRCRTSSCRFQGCSNPKMRTLGGSQSMQRPTKFSESLPLRSTVRDRSFLNIIARREGLY